MLKSLLLVIAIAASVIVTSGLTTDGLAKGKDKGGTYVGGQGSSHKGGEYLPPPGHRYDKRKGGHRAPEVKPATPTSTTPSQ